MIKDVSVEEMIDPHICWSDVFLDDYLVAEVSVRRVFDTRRTWSLRFALVDATRVATTP